MISRTIEENPPFPDDVPVAPIGRISLQKILEHDNAEAAVALEACRTHGFFYLDLTSVPIGEELIQNAEDLQDLAKQVFKRPFEEKDAHALIKGKTLMGYK